MAFCYQCKTRTGGLRKGWEGMERDGKGWEGMERDGKGWRGMERDGEGWRGMESRGKEIARVKRVKGGERTVIQQ